MTIYRVYIPTRNRVLNLIDRQEKIFETYIYCPSYISRSGLTYDLCYEWNGEKWMEKRGLVPISEKILTYIKEGLWHATAGKAMPKEFRDHGEELKVADKILRNIYDNNGLQHLIVRVANGFTVYIKRYYDIEKLIASNVIARQGNLEIWRIETFTSKQKERLEQLAMHGTNDTVNISSHILTNASFKVIAERETPSIQAKLIYMRRIWSATGRYLPLILLHPEHEKLEIEEFDNGLYLLLHIRDRGIE